MPFVPGHAETSVFRFFLFLCHLVKGHVFLYVQVNERDTYGSIDVLAKKLVAEILDHISFHYSHESHPRRIRWADV